MSKLIQSPLGFRFPISIGVLLGLTTVAFVPIAEASPPGVVERDEGMILDIVFRGRDEFDDADADADFVPIPIQDRIYYCDVAREAAEVIWEVTAGQHYVWKVHFYDGFPQGVVNRRIRWYHKDVDGHVPLDPSKNPLFMRMYDMAEGCVP